MTGQSYPTPMLPSVDYGVFSGEVFESVTDLEYETLQNITAFLDKLKAALLEENLMQAPELMIAHLAAYLAAFTVGVLDESEAEKLKAPIKALAKRHAQWAYQGFSQYPVNSSVTPQAQKSENLAKFREHSPGSIVTQTVRLGRVMMDCMEALRNNRMNNLGFSRQKQTELFCPEIKLFELLLPLIENQLAGWKETLNGKSMLYAINQLAIQLGWLVGYFSHLDKKEPSEGQYLDYLESCFDLFLGFTGKFRQALSKKTNNEPSQTVEHPLIHDIAHLSHAIQMQQPPAVTEFQKQTAIVNTGLQKAITELTLEGMAPKVVLMSVFFFWFRLEASMQGVTPEALDESSPFETMEVIISLVKKTTETLPEPELSDEVKVLNEKMQQLKSALPNPERLDQVPKDQAVEQTARVNALIYSLTADYLKQDYHPEVIANCLFNHWLRFSVLFGVTESAWQKMDFYFAELLKAVRDYLAKLFKEQVKCFV